MTADIDREKLGGIAEAGQAAKIAELEAENAGLTAGSSYDEAEAARIDEALAIFSSDLSEFETRADAVWCLARAWENVIEALDLGDTVDDPAQRIREMIEYIGVLNGVRASLESERDQLRKQVKGRFIGMLTDDAILKAIGASKLIAASDDPSGWNFDKFRAAILSAASALEQKEQG